jgi:hypothetical protein
MIVSSPFQCLAYTNDSLVQKTVMRLPPKYVIQFLQQVVAKFHVRESQGLCINTGHIFLLDLSDVCFTSITLYSFFQAKPSRGMMLMVWIKAVLTAHASYLLSLPNLIDYIAPLYRFAKVTVPCRSCSSVFS